jgi:hypothetical protein
MSEPGSQFIHERNPNFHTSLEVEDTVDYLRANSNRIPNEPGDKILSRKGICQRRHINRGSSKHR